MAQRRRLDPLPLSYGVFVDERPRELRRWMWSQGGLLQASVHPGPTECKGYCDVPAGAMPWLSDTELGGPEATGLTRQKGEGGPGS